MKMRVAQEADRNILIRDYLQHVEPDLAEAEWFAKRNLMQDQALFLEEDGALVGTMTFGMRDRVKAGLAEITSLRIIPSRRGQGHGRTLLQQGLKVLSDMYREKGAELRRVYAFVAEPADACVCVLESSGFQAVASLLEFRARGQQDALYIWEGGA